MSSLNARQRNDLMAPALSRHPDIGAVLTELRETKPLFAGMSGSGATCFAIFADPAQRDAATEALRAAQPDWWIMPTGEWAR